MKNEKNEKKIVTAIFSLLGIFVSIQMHKMCGKKYEATRLSMISNSMYHQPIWNSHLVTRSDQLHLVSLLCNPVLAFSGEISLTFSTCTSVVASKGSYFSDTYVWY